MTKMKMKIVMNPSHRFSTTASSLLRYFYTAAVEKPAAPATTFKGGNQRRDELYKRLSPLGITGGSAIDALNRYISEGNVTRKFELDTCVWELRKYGRFRHALEVMEWMETSNIKFSPIDNAKQLDLISKVKGVSAAENYFNGLPPSAKNKATYGALLNCYCRETLTGKAQALFEKMDEMHILTSLAFTNLMTLYMRLHLPEKVPPLIQVMKNRNFPLTIQSYSIWMTSYSYLNDIEGVEKVFEEAMQNNGKQYHDWTTFSNLAAAYVRAGLHEKAESALKKLEEQIGKMWKCDREPFHFLISLYAGTSNLGEVHRIWKSLKSAFEPTTNTSTLRVLQALSKLGDLNSFKEIFEEWESTCISYDKRLGKTAIMLYLKHGMIEAAEKVFDNMLKRHKGPFYVCRGLLMSYYLEKHQIDSALKLLTAAVSEVKNNEWHPTSDDVNRFMEHFKKKSDVHGAEKFCAILKKVNSLDFEAYKLLLETYVAASKTSPELCRRMMDDGITINSELEDLLTRVCPK